MSLAVMTEIGRRTAAKHEGFKKQGRDTRPCGVHSIQCVALTWTVESRVYLLDCQPPESCMAPCGGLPS